MNKRIVRLGIAGLGAMGVQHAQWIHAGKVVGMRLCAVADPGQRASAFAAEQLPDVPLFQSAEEMMLSDKIDAVLLCGPHHVHAPQTQLAFKQGLHVLTEKPVGLHVAEVRENLALAQKQNLCFAMMFNQRMNPLYRAVRETIASGRLGHLHRVVYIATDCFRPQCYYHSAAWRATWSMEGGGMLMNQNAHALDLLLWWLGMPQAVTAHLGFGKFHPTLTVEDEVSSYLCYADGGTCNLITCTGDYPGTSMLEVHGERGKLSLQGKRLILEELDTPCDEFSQSYLGGFGHPSSRLADITPEEENTAHVGILQNFSDCILHGTPLTATAEDGLRALELAHAMYCSAWEQSTMCLPVEDERFEREWQQRVRQEKPRQAVETALDLQSAWKS